MSSVPAHLRGAASGMRATFQNSGMVLSIGVFFSLMVAGLAGSLPHTLTAGLTSHGVPASAARAIGNLPPVGTLFAAFLGYNPIRTLLGSHILSQLPAGNAQTLTGRQFFPDLISGPFHHGLVVVFSLAIVMACVGAAASLARAQHSRGSADPSAHEEQPDDEAYRSSPLSPVTGTAQALADRDD